MKTKFFHKSLLALTAFSVISTGTAADNLLNVSYDPIREFYAEYNQAFARHWKEKSGKDVTIDQSHGGSGKQGRAVIDGLQADVVTLALANDINAIAKHAGLLPEDWQKRLPNNSAPYTSTIVFIVRAGNPKNIKDWDDLAKEGVSVITPNPKTSGGAQWNYLAAWEFARRKYGNDDKAKEFVRKLYNNVPVLDSGARGSTNTFVQRGLGDVFISWENEAFLVQKEFGADKFTTIVPSLSILAEPSVALVDKVVDKKKTREVAQAYLDYLYSEEGQDLAGKHFYRPRSEKASAKYASAFPKLELFTIDDAFGGWVKAAKTHFVDGGTFDEIYTPGR
jgi:sulfate transport system substrate-binding protein